MNYKIGEHVSYCSGEICTIESVTKECFDGVNELEYFKLVPINSGKSSYYVPCQNCGERIRKLMTKEEIYRLIDEIPNSSATWCDDKNKRKNMFHSVLKGNDHHEIISMMHTLYIQREQQRKNGKKLLASDEKAMSEAEHLLYQEFAFVLGIEENEVENFIENRLNK